MKHSNNLKDKFIFCMTGLCLLLTSQSISAQQPLDKIIAVINDDVITQNEFDGRVSDFAIQLKIDKNSEKQMNALRKQVLERMILSRIQMQMAGQFGIGIDDINLNRMIEQIAESNNMTLDQLKNTLSKDGISFANFREQTREDLIIKQLQQRMVANKINISDQEIQRFIDNNINKNNKNEKFLIHHILINTPESASPEELSKAKEKANRLLSEINSGADFKTLAMQQSDGRNALKGGNLGWRSSNELPESFVTAISDINVGETTQPIQSASGFHLLKLVDRSTNKNIVTQTLARHILIRTSKQRNDDDARELLSQLKQRIEQNEDFSKLAEEYSQDPGSKIKGGELGWADPGTFVTEFEDVMNSLSKNEISDPFRSQFGWHILQVMDRRQQDKTQATLKSQANRAIHKRKYDEELRLWTRRIRDEAYVEYIGDMKPDN
ncbi:MAG: peptidylprolyl isomerase [Gammaproteobacteria bacterium]|nr:peptidylprolyl isomerase [Gammaproteobacteria bacterium]MCW8922381.1 peptidylprolyl isomerase [Gammaproteobacteria bacterium]